MNINELTDDMISKYFLMLTDARKKRIAGMNDPSDRRSALCCEILARQCLSQLCDAPEFSFELLCNPGGKSVVGNFDANISIIKAGNVIGCAASKNFVGLGLTEIKPFSFNEAQNILSDSEIRFIFSESKYSFTELVNASECREDAVMRRFALFKSLKDAHFYASGRGIRTQMKNLHIAFDGKSLLCSDSEAVISASYIDIKENIAVSVIERCVK